MPTRSKIRNIVVVVTALATFVFVLFAFVDANPERQRLEEERRRLDAELKRTRAMAENRAAHLKEQEELRARAQTLLRKWSFDPKSLRAELEAAGVTVEVTQDEAAPIPNVRLVTVTLSGQIGAPRTKVFAVLVPFENIFGFGSYKQDASNFEFTFTGASFSFPEPDATLVANPREDRWYGRVNDHFVVENEEKKRELRRLKKELRHDEFTRMRADMDTLLASVDSIETPGRFMAALQALVDGPDAVFGPTEVRLNDTDHLIARGQLSAEITTAEIAKRVAPQMEVVSFEDRKDLAKLQLRFTKDDSD